MSTALITQPPEIIGVPEALKKGFVGLRVSLSEIPTVGWLGYSVPPAHFYHFVNRPFCSLSFEHIGYTVSIEGLITACKESGGRVDLLNWLKKMRESGDYCEYFLIAADWCEYEP